MASVKAGAREDVRARVLLAPPQWSPAHPQVGHQRSFSEPHSIKLVAAISRLNSKQINHGGPLHGLD
eukprot:360458-Chlamydomonas_euryale.AAC.3